MAHKRQYKYRGRNKPWTRCYCLGCQVLAKQIRLKYKYKKVWEVKDG